MANVHISPTHSLCHYFISSTHYYCWSYPQVLVAKTEHMFDVPSDRR